MRRRRPMGWGGAHLPESDELLNGSGGDVDNTNADAGRAGAKGGRGVATLAVILRDEGPADRVGDAAGGGGGGHGIGRRLRGRPLMQVQIANPTNNVRAHPWLGRGSDHQARHNNPGRHWSGTTAQYVITFFCTVRRYCVPYNMQHKFSLTRS